jgi:hypothetical protein
MPASSITDYHAICRDAAKDALALAVPGLEWYAVEDLEDAAKKTLPCGVVCCVGPEQDRPEFGTNARDGIGFPVAVMLLGVGKTHGDKQTGPTTLTGFRRVVRTTFHKKRLSGVAESCECEVSDSGPLVDEKSPLFQRLSTAMVVNCVGRFPRTD